MLCNQNRQASERKPLINSQWSILITMYNSLCNPLYYSSCIWLSWWQHTYNKYPADVILLLGTVSEHQTKALKLEPWTSSLTDEAYISVKLLCVSLNITNHLVNLLNNHVLVMVITCRCCRGVMKCCCTSCALCCREGRPYPASLCRYVDVSVDGHIC